MPSSWSQPVASMGQLIKKEKVRAEHGGRRGDVEDVGKILQSGTHGWGTSTQWYLPLY